MNSILIGIDPGKEGALAVLYPDGRAEVWDTPTGTVGNKHIYDVPGMAALLKPFKGSKARAYLEMGQAMPGQGVSSTFQFGLGCGLWEGLLAASGIAYETVRPAIWKRAIMGFLADSKDASRINAKTLFPEIAERFNRKRDHGRAEALLLCEWGRRRG